MENQPGGWFSPPPALSALPPFQLPQFGRRSWNPFPSERIPLPLPFLHSLRLCCRSQGDAHGIRSRRNGFPSPAARAYPPFRLPQFGRRSWNPFPSERIPPPCPSCIPSVWAAAIRATLMESVPVGTDSPFPAARALLPFGLPQSRRRSWNPFPWNGFPFPAVFAFPPFGLPQSRRRSWNPFPSERIPLPLPFLRSLRLGCRNQGNRQRERPSRRTVFPMSALCARSISLAAASDYFFVWVETRVGHRVSKGNSVSCGTRLRALP